jgi:ribosomal protein S18 acetylase RimI-like enzyme
MVSLATAMDCTPDPLRCDGRFTTEAVRPARPGERRALAAVLARAFTEDPVVRWLLPSAREWTRGGARFFEVQLRRDLDLAEILTTPRLEGVGVWTPPGPSPVSRLAEARFRLGMLAVLRGRVGRALRMAGRLEEARPEVPHWYLGTLGTDPTCQGRGIGSRLLEPVLTRCDASGTPAYLETATRANVRFYRRRGFRLRACLGVPGGPPVFTMWREPR